MSKRIQFVKVRRMCGGGLWRPWGFFTDHYPCQWFRKGNFKRYLNPQHILPRKIDGALIHDGIGYALAWRGDWK